MARKEKRQHVVRAVCGDCGGTGVYQGMCEPHGTAVVCLGCQGSGCMELIYTPFERRRRRTGVKFVYQSGGKFVLTGVGPIGEFVTYEEFLDGQFPETPKKKARA